MSHAQLNRPAYSTIYRSTGKPERHRPGTSTITALVTSARLQILGRWKTGVPNVLFMLWTSRRDGATWKFKQWINGFAIRGTDYSTAFCWWEKNGWLFQLCMNGMHQRLKNHWSCRDVTSWRTAFTPFYLKRNAGNCSKI
jgi:hypothetical protein